MSLQLQLDQMKTQFLSKAPQEAVEIMNAHTELLRSEALAEKGPKVGQVLPSFSLPNAKGNSVALNTLLSKGALVISFYRGGWCPYCNIELKALQNRLSEINTFGANLIAITPEDPDHSLSTSEKNELSFEVLTDKDNNYAKQLGLVFQMPENLRALYTQFGIHVDQHNANNDFELPLPTTLVIAPSGEITYTFIDEDYTKRAEPDAIVNALKSVNTAV